MIWGGSIGTNGIRRRLQPDYTAPTVPAGVPAWAYLQAKDLDYFQRIADFYIDKRQAWDGEFGGGLGDDSDFTNLFPSVALMGVEPEKLKTSLSRELEAMYENKMWTNGLATAQFDELHAYEDGLNVLGPDDDDGLRQSEGHRARDGDGEAAGVADRRKCGGASACAVGVL